MFDLDGQPIGQHCVNHPIQARKKVGIGPLPQWSSTVQAHRVDAEAHAVKPQFGHQGNVGVVGVTICI